MLDVASALALAAIVLIAGYIALVHTHGGGRFAARPRLHGGPSPVPAIEDPPSAPGSCCAAAGAGAHFPSLVPPPADPTGARVHSRQN